MEVKEGSRWLNTTACLLEEHLFGDLKAKAVQRYNLLQFEGVESCQAAIPPSPWWEPGAATPEQVL
eukprot:1823027-Amphidinium_carterae.1